MYVTVCDPCLDNHHDRCDEKVEGSHLQVEREQVRRRGAVGGGACICAVCRPEVKLDWYLEVRESAEKARAHRVSGLPQSMLAPTEVVFDDDDEPLQTVRLVPVDEELDDW